MADEEVSEEEGLKGVLTINPQLMARLEALRQDLGLPSIAPILKNAIKTYEHLARHRGQILLVAEGAKVSRNVPPGTIEPYVVPK